MAFHVKLIHPAVLMTIENLSEDNGWNEFMQRSRLTSEFLLRLNTSVKIYRGMGSAKPTEAVGVDGTKGKHKEHFS